MIDPSAINSIFRLNISPEGNFHHQIVGKFLLHDGTFQVLEDHSNLFNGIAEGPVTPKLTNLLNSLGNSQRMRVVNHKNWGEGKHPELIYSNPESVTSQAPPEPRVNDATARFLYDRPPGASKILFTRGNLVFLDKNLLEDHEIDDIHDSLENGTAKLSYLPESAELSKMEKLTKAIDQNLSEALSQLREAVKAGHVHPNALKSVSNEIFKDSLVPTIGNKRAYEDFKSRPRKGIHLAADLNNFKQINDTYGHEVGDQAIKAYGNALRSAMDESVGHKNGKVFRNGGDETRAFVNTPEQASSFARKFREKLDEIPPIGGTHRLSASIGIGHTPELADKASYHAKEAKNSANYMPGQAKTHVHSLLPGTEGPVPVNSEE